MGSLAEAIPVERLARYVEYWVLRLQGVYPSLIACHRCGGDVARGGRIDPADSGFVCRACATGQGIGLSSDSVRFLRAAAGTPPSGLRDVDLPAPAARELERAHRQLITAHLEKELRSAKVLRAMARAGT